MSNILSARTRSAETTLTHRCASEVLKLIRTGQLRPGQRLGEVAMARRLKLGRAAVRAAFDRLAWAGLLERIPRSGTFVRKTSLEDFSEIMDVRAGLESMAARLACTRLSHSELERFAQIAARLDDLGAKFDAEISRPSERQKISMELQELEIAFHLGLAEASGNQRIYGILKEQHLVERCFIMALGLPYLAGQSAVLRKKVPLHRETMKALISRDPDTAGNAVIRQLLTSKECAIAVYAGFRSTSHSR
ncbi:MAG: GntR family transcriptional regulator [Verrucomicrobia bacterium]|nr:GntR family transcriptional regulator [Verrucomicrobiota bacterium]